MKTIVFVLSAGAKANQYWKVIKLPFFLKWPPIKEHYEASGVETEFINRLR